MMGYCLIDRFRYFAVHAEVEETMIYVPQGCDVVALLAMHCLLLRVRTDQIGFFRQHTSPDVQASSSLIDYPVSYQVALMYCMPVYLLDPRHHRMVIG